MRSQHHPVRDPIDQPGSAPIQVAQQFLQEVLLLRLN
jgi:hypothetical protein